MSRRVVVSPRSELRAREATAWLAAREAGREVLVVGATSDAAGEAIRAVALARGSAFGMHRSTLGRLAAELAKHELVERDLAAVGGLPIEALCARVVQRMRRDGALGRFEVVSDKPGLPRALARTLGELRLAGATPAVVREHSAELAAALVALELELAAARLADRAIVYRLATEVVADRARQGLLIGLDAVWIDVPVRSAVEQALIAAIAGRAESALATVPFGDDGSEKRLAAALGVGSERLTSATISAGSELDPGAATPADERKSSLARVQAQLFAPRRERAELDDSIEIFSAPGESRECVEIARRVLHAAERGVPFDRMAVLLRTTESYRVHLEEAFARAAIPVHFDQGTRLPDPTGRAFLALLACAGERLSVRRFAEYLSLGEVPATSEPPPAVPSGDRWVPPEEELLPIALAGGDEDDEDDELGEILVVRGGKPPSREELARALGLGTAATSASESTSTSTATNTNPGTGSGSGTGTSESTGQVFAPWRWEQLLVDAAVIGGLDRWERRLDGLEAQLQLEDSEHGRDRRERALADLRQLRAFAIPLLRDLAALPAYATWGQWIDLLSALATRALRKPDRVMTILSALQPMAEVGPIELREVQLVLGERLAELVVRPPGSRYGKLLVAPIEAARGRSFDLVFVPGLAERMFPQKLVEDPLLLDLARTDLPLALDRRDDRVLAERLALRLALGAATERVVLSYPRIDLEQGRPRVPSFYGLEILEAGEGALPGFDDLGRRANVTGAARIGWPAPGAPIDAIDEAEHDLALLDTLVHDPAQLSLLPETRKPVPKMGAAHYLLGANAHLARALRTRARRWDVRAWKPADGLIVSTPEGRAALAAHSPEVRSFSPTALEQFAACPYRFVLRTIVRLEAREAPEPIETIDPLERGSLVHEVQFELLGELRALGLLPVTEVGLTTARDLLDAVLDRVAGRYRDKLFPAIERVWNDAISSIRADLREWLRRMADDGEWTPARFELAFGLDTQTGRDPASRDEPVPTAIGLTLRGSIDLVERGSNGRVRATDYKTGKAKVAPGSVIGGGKSLQPVLYALVLEKMLPQAQVEGGRLYYCTTRGDFQDVSVPLDETALASANLLASTLRHHFERGFFPAAPDKGECTYCDFRAVCGPYEEQRSHRKAKEPLVQLRRLREQR